MSAFAQQTRLVSTSGDAEKLVAKFIEAAEFQRDNESCELMVAGKSDSEDDVVYVTEVWSNEAAWEKARQGAAIAEWAKGVSALVKEWPASTRLTGVGGKGVQ